MAHGVLEKKLLFFINLPLPPPRDDLGPKVLAPKCGMSHLALLVFIVFYKVFYTFRVKPIDGDAQKLSKRLGLSHFLTC